MYEYNSVDNFLNDYYDGKIGFPYKREYRSDRDILEMFNKLKKYDVNSRIVHKPYHLRNIKVDHEKMLFKNDYWLILSNDEDYEDFNTLSDMFQERCRMECKVTKYNPSPLEYWRANIKTVAAKCLDKYKLITPYNMRETMYTLKLSKECTSHKPNNIIAMIQLFNAKSVLDISAGWGDRLIGAMVAGVEYLGVDPNRCLHPGYREMINFFNESNKSKYLKYSVLDGEFEKIELPHDKKFDLVYTSPPYFDLEIYTNKYPQSINRYKNEDLWFRNFLKPSVIKAWTALNNNGVFAININQKSDKRENYVYTMIKLIDSFENSVYLGLISYANRDLANPQPIWIWRKSNEYGRYKNRYISIKNKN